MPLSSSESETTAKSPQKCLSALTNQNGVKDDPGKLSFLTLSSLTTAVSLQKFQKWTIPNRLIFVKTDNPKKIKLTFQIKLIKLIYIANLLKASESLFNTASKLVNAIFFLFFTK